MSTTDTALPQVGAKIRVWTADIATGYTVTHEGIVKGVFPVDFHGGPVEHVDFGDGNGISLRPSCGYSGGWEELEPPKPPLPAEPEVGVFVACGGDGNLLPFFRRWDEGWLQVHGNPSDYTTWPEIVELSRARAERDPVTLIAAPDLAELVEAFAEAARGWHRGYCWRESNDVEFWNCPDSDCERNRELMKKHGADVVQS